jgi:putative beta-barrel porin MtrB/PioB
MKRKLIAVLVANLFAGTGAAYAQSTGLKWTGEVSAGLRYTAIKANDDSKFREYRDIGNGTDLINSFEMRAEDERRRFSIFFENLGSDDKYLDVRGTEYGNWKFRLYDSEFRHRFGSGPGALTPFTGVGSSVLTGTFPNLNPATWTPFDDSLKRRDTGGFAEWSGGSPWYIRFDGNEVKREGIKVIAGALGTSPGNGSIDLPAPVDWRTYNASGEAGYQGPKQHFAITGSYSKFENDNLFLNWSNPFFAPGLPGLRSTEPVPVDRIDRAVLPRRSQDDHRFVFAQFLADARTRHACLLQLPRQTERLYPDHVQSHRSERSSMRRWRLHYRVVLVYEAYSWVGGILSARSDQQIRGRL